MAFRHVPFRTPMFENGAMTRPWILFFQQFQGGGGAGTVETLTVNLVDGPGTTTVSSVNDAVEGALLAVDITQSAVGGREIAWSSQFHSNVSPDIPMWANSRVKKLFVGKADGKWHDFSQLS